MKLTTGLWKFNLDFFTLGGEWTGVRQDEENRANQSQNSTVARSHFTGLLLFFICVKKTR